MAAGMDRSARDKQRAAYLKSQGIERTSMRCALCYTICACEGPKSRYTHICHGGRSRDKRLNNPNLTFA